MKQRQEYEDQRLLVELLPFNIFMKHIGLNFKYEYLLYVDDLKIYNKISSELDVTNVQEDIIEICIAAIII